MRGRCSTRRASSTSTAVIVPTGRYHKVATDITARREADEQFRRQELKLQHTSRLVTMGEMASSLAHELNQPLTAIANYCSGLMARIRSLQNQEQNADPGLLLEALQKTSDQAERAGEHINEVGIHMMQQTPLRKETVLQGTDWQQAPE